MESMEKKKRSGKTTRQQFSLYLEELENNINFQTNKYQPTKPDILEQSWTKLSLRLNSSGGPSRTTSQWKRIFSDWRSQVRKRARRIKLHQQQTGGGPPENILPDLEEKLLDLTGTTVIDGLEGIPELGISGTESSSFVSKNFVATEHNDICGNIENHTESISETGDIKNIINQQNDRVALKKQRSKKGKLSTSIEQLIKNDKVLSNVSGAVLQEINTNLQGLVNVNRREVALLAKLKIKYGIEVQSEDDNQCGNNNQSDDYNIV